MCRHAYDAGVPPESQPTFEECMQAFSAEYVRSWLDEHPEIGRGEPAKD